MRRRCDRRAREHGVRAVADRIDAREIEEPRRLGVDRRPALLTRALRIDLVLGKGCRDLPARDGPGRRGLVGERRQARCFVRVAELGHAQTAAGECDPDRAGARAGAEGVCTGARVVSRSPTCTWSRSPANATLIVNQSSIGNATGCQWPSSWKSCQEELPFVTGVYWIESGLPTWCGRTQKASQLSSSRTRQERPWKARSRVTARSSSSTPSLSSLPSSVTSAGSPDRRTHSRPANDSRVRLTAPHSQAPSSSRLTVSTGRA